METQTRACTERCAGAQVVKTAGRPRNLCSLKERGRVEGGCGGFWLSAGVPDEQGRPTRRGRSRRETGLQAARRIPSGPIGERPAAERGTSGGANVGRPFRYRDLGLAA